MGKCTKIRRKIKRVCSGSLNRKIVLYNRAITVPELGSVDYGEEFTIAKTVWSMIETPKGLTLFDGANTIRDITHNIYIRYLNDFEVTAETWVGLLQIIQNNERYLDIIRVQNIEENNRFLLLNCSLRGSNAVPANFA